MSPGLRRSAVGAAVLSSIEPLECGAAVQAPIFDWEGTVEVEVFVDGKWQSSTTVTLKAMAGERKKYRLRLTEPLPMNEKGWWVRIHVGLQPDGSDGVVYSAGDYPPNDAAISWIPSVGWPFDPGDWESGQCKGQGPFQCESKWRENCGTGADRQLDQRLRRLEGDSPEDALRSVADLIIRETMDARSPSLFPVTGPP